MYPHQPFTAQMSPTAGTPCVTDAYGTHVPLESAASPLQYSPHYQSTYNHSYANQYWFKHSPPPADMSAGGYKAHQHQQYHYPWAPASYLGPSSIKIESDAVQDFPGFSKARRCIKCQCPNCVGEESGIRNRQAKKVSPSGFFSHSFEPVLPIFLTTCLPPLLQVRFPTTNLCRYTLLVQKFHTTIAGFLFLLTTHLRNFLLKGSNIPLPRLQKDFFQGRIVYYFSCSEVHTISLPLFVALLPHQGQMPFNSQVNLNNYLSVSSSKAIFLKLPKPLSSSADLFLLLSHNLSSTCGALLLRGISNSKQLFFCILLQGLFFTATFYICHYPGYRKISSKVTNLIYFSCS